ncbi:MAG: hypothetical protein JSS76_00015 [Bacteroidetes bacterium]|nr:hypothetical protein [Bacteroidota bacterium]MBS1683107.1 hypothetical protein [Bacteroidota bacterium]
MRYLIALSLAVLTILPVTAQTSQKGLNVNNKGAEAKSSKGGGVEAHKGQVAAKSSSGHGVEANKKGMEVKGSKGGMTIQKKKFEIKGKNTNIHFGK